MIANDDAMLIRERFPGSSAGTKLRFKLDFEWIQLGVIPPRRGLHSLISAMRFIVHGRVKEGSLQVEGLLGPSSFLSNPGDKGEFARSALRDGWRASDEELFGDLTILSFLLVRMGWLFPSYHVPIPGGYPVDYECWQKSSIIQ